MRFGCARSGTVRVIIYVFGSIFSSSSYPFDQIVSCICQFVEGNRVDIKSGWRSLYSGLRMVNSAHLASLVNVFKVFLDTNNSLVFSNAAVDFIACLLKHIRGPGEYSL